MKMTSKVIGVELTELCNLSCVHCYLDRTKPSLLDANIAAKIADLALDAGFYEVYITGGEPLLNKIFLDVYKVFRLKGFITSIYSNGTYISDRVKHTFSELMPHRIEITVYGMSNDTYEKITGKREFHNVISNIRALNKMGCPILLKYNLMKDTKDDFERFVYFCSEENIKYIVNAQIIPKLNGDTSPLLQRLNRDEIAAIGEKYKLDFFPDDSKNQLLCDLGDKLYFNSQLQIRGCPVLTKLEFSLIDARENSLEHIKKIFKSYKDGKKHNYCPAWVDLEGRGNVSRFLHGCDHEG